MLAGVLLGALTVFVIDRRLYAAAVTAGICAVLAFFGLINAVQVGINASPGVSLGYLFLALLLFGFGWAGRNDKEVVLQDDLLFVNGTLMRGLGLHGNLQGAEFVAEMKTAPKYRMHDIGGAHPGMYEVEDDGVAVTGELYMLPLDVLLRVIEGEPAGLYRGAVELEDGRVVPGVLYQEDMAKAHPVIADGNWRNHTGANK